MIKIKKITLSGFRGILTKQRLDLTNNGGNPTSLAVYGLNSSGKTSFVDGLEWFLSPNNEIEWLKRENAGCHSYPHQEAQDGNTFVEIEFSDPSFGDLTKTFNHQRITKPTLSQENKFLKLYQEFTIRPYLRYLEIIDFVFNRTGVEKYQKLANWMGFEEELAFQEKLALEIMPKLKGKEQELIIQNGYVNNEIKKLTGLMDIDDASLVNFCNDLLKQVNVAGIRSLNDLPIKIKELDKKKTGGNESKIAIITKAQTIIEAFRVDSDLIGKLKKLADDIGEFNKKKESTEKIDYISLYEKAYLVLNNQIEEDTVCPVCNTSWKRNQLLEHIKQELETLKEIKNAHSDILQEIEQVKTSIENEKVAIAPLQTSLQSIKDIEIDMECSNLPLYKLSLDNICKSFEGSIFETDINADEIEKVQKDVSNDLSLLIEGLKKENNLLQPSKEEVLINDITEKIRLLGDKITRKNEISEKQRFFNCEINNVKYPF